jgi:hypothetical protein
MCLALDHLLLADEDVALGLSVRFAAHADAVPATGNNVNVLV